MSNPRIVARFLLDTKGLPEVVKRPDVNHYRIKIFIEAPPADTYAVTYQLHESYYDPVRESRDATTGFAEETTSYGDFTIQAQVRTRSRVEVTAAELSTALAFGHKDDMSADISRALEEIRAN